jgi:hypothetical protein
LWAMAVQKIIVQREEITNIRNKRFEKGRELAWEKEAGKLEEIWKKVLVSYP